MAKLTNRLISQTTAAGGSVAKKRPKDALKYIRERNAAATPVKNAAQTSAKQAGTASPSAKPSAGSAAPVTEATTAMGVTYNPMTTTPSAADLKQIEGNMPTYKQSQALTDALAELNSWRGSKPGEYQSPYASQIESLYDKVSNPEKFSYDPNADPLYQMYADRYGQSARRSMNDTMADAAALTGGYGNSYAQAVAQQAYDEQMQGLNDALPTLYNQAYGEYTDRQNQLLNQLKTAQDMEGTAYNRYRDTVSDYYTGLDALTKAANNLYEREYGQYTDALKQANTNRDYYLTKAASEAASEAASSGGSGGRRRSSGGTGSAQSANYKSILKVAQDMDEDAAYGYVARMADQGYLTNEEADRMLSMNLGVDVAKHVTSGNSGTIRANKLTDALSSAVNRLTGNKSTARKTPSASSKKKTTSKPNNAKKSETEKTKFNRR